MNSFDSFLIGIFIGILLSSVYIFWVINDLKKSGDILFEPTEKYKNRIKQIKEEIERDEKKG